VALAGCRCMMNSTLMLNCSTGRVRQTLNLAQPSLTHTHTRTHAHAHTHTRTHSHLDPAHAPECPPFFGIHCMAAHLALLRSGHTLVQEQQLAALRQPGKVVPVPTSRLRAGNKCGTRHLCQAVCARMDAGCRGAGGAEAASSFTAPAGFLQRHPTSSGLAKQRRRPARCQGWRRTAGP
jgi:hypothetical protein